MKKDFQPGDLIRIAPLAGPGSSNDDNVGLILSPAGFMGSMWFVLNERGTIVCQYELELRKVAEKNGEK